MYIQNKNSKKWETKLELLDKEFYNSIREDIKKVIFYSNTINGAVYHISKDINQIYTDVNVNDMFFTPEKDIKYNFTSYLIVDFILSTNYNLSNINTVIDNVVLNEGNFIVLNNQIVSSENGLYTYTSNTFIKSNVIYDIIFVKNGIRKDTYWEIVNNVYVETTFFLIKNKINYLNINENTYFDMCHDNGTANISAKNIYIGANGLILVEENNIKNILYNTYKYTYYSIVLLNDFYLAVGENGIVIKIERNSLEVSKLDLSTFEKLNKIVNNPYNLNQVIIIGDNNTVFMSHDNGYNFHKIDNIFDDFINVNDIIFIDSNNFKLFGDRGNITSVNYNIVSNNPSYSYTKIKLNYNLVNTVVENIFDVAKSNIYIDVAKFDNSIMDIPRIIGDSDFTFDFWIKLYTPSSTKKYIISRSISYDPLIIDNPFYYGFNLYTLNSVIYFEFGDMSIPTPLTISTITPLTDNLYHHISVSRKGGVFKIYLEGILKNTISSTFTGGLNSNYKGSVIRIGGEMNVDYNGDYTTNIVNSEIFSIHNLRFFNRELSNNEIAKYKNIYDSNIKGLISMYKFNKKDIIGHDIIANNDSIYLSALSYIFETYNVELYLTDKYIIINSDSFYNVSKNIVYKHTLSTNIKCFLYNNNIYVIDNDLLYVEFPIINIFDDISDKTLTYNVSKQGVYKNYYFINNELYLLGYNDISILDIDSQLENVNISNVVLNSNLSYYNGVKFNNSNTLYNSVEVSDNLNSSISLYSNSDYKVIFNYTTTNQSNINTVVKDSNGNLLSYGISYNVEIYISEIINSVLKVSLDNINFHEIKTEGKHQFLLGMGNNSNIYIIATAIDNSKKIYVKIKDILISDKITANYNRVLNNLFSPKSIVKYNIPTASFFYNYYFPQFLNTDFLTYKSALRKYINLQSLQINGNEVLDLNVYKTNGFPTIGYTNSAVTMSCNGSYCLPNVSGSNFDRFIDNIGFTKDINGNYVDSNNTNLLTYLDLNTDISNISNGIINVNSPFLIKSNNSDSFSLKVESMFLTSSTNVAYIGSTYSGGLSTFSNVKLNMDNTNNITVTSTTHSNMVIATNSTGGVFNILCRTNKELVNDTLYRVEFQFLNSLTSSIGLHLGTVSNYGVTISATTSKFIGLNLRKSGNEDIYISGATYTNFKIVATTNSTFSIKDIFITDKLPDIYEISLNKDNGQYNMLKNGNVTNGFLSNNGSLVNVDINNVSTYSTNYNNIVNGYIDSKENKFLFMDYDIGSKLAFFNSNLEYNIPNNIEIPYDTSLLYLNISNITNENNWINYYKDKLKTLQYLTPNVDITFSTNFSKIIGSNVISIANTAITKNISNIGYIMPNFVSNSNSLTTLSITPSNSSFDIYWHNNILVVKASSTYNVEIGDVMMLEHPSLAKSIKSIVIYKNIYNVSGTDYTYIYMNSDINESMINDLKKSGITKITNLNKYTSNDDLIIKFNNHYISKGYKMVLSNGKILVTPLVNNETVYYNLQCEINAYLSYNITYLSQYNKSFINFKYTPSYSLMNILSELKDVNDNIIFDNNYTFSNTSVGISLLLDNNHVNISDYKILFNNNSYSNLYSTYYLYTFVDIIIYDINDNVLLTINKNLILDIIQTTNLYTLKFSKKINFPTNSHHIDVKTRNKLVDISNDLNELNNIQSNLNLNSLGKLTYKSDLPFKINTDSYYKIFTLDSNINNYITAICYTNTNNVLSLSMLKNDKMIKYDVIAVEPYSTQNQFCSYEVLKYGLTTSSIGTLSSIMYLSNTFSTDNSDTYLRNINSSDRSIYLNKPFSMASTYQLKFNINSMYNTYVVITNGTQSNTFSTIGTKTLNISNSTYSKLQIFVTSSSNSLDISQVELGNSFCMVNATYSKLTLNATYSGNVNSYVNISTQDLNLSGYNTVREVINNKDLVIYKDYLTSSSTYSLSYYDFDPYMNFQPTDISKINSDLLLGITTKINESDLKLNNYLEINSTIDLNKKRFILIDGMTINDIYERYKWFIEAEVENAVIGEDANGLVWYSGTWYYGRWFGSKWYSGTWYSGEWYSGDMFSKIVEIKSDVAYIKNTDVNATVWYDGNVHDGNISDITWLNGKFYKGSATNVNWLSGNFHNGTMNACYFKGGNFINGRFVNGNISQDYNNSNWINGIFINSNFENGTWNNGTIIEKGGVSHFGNKTTPDKAAIFKAGDIISSKFGNLLNSNTIIKSADISYASFSNVTIDNAVVKNGDLHSVNLNDINIVAINLYNTNQYIVIEGIYDFNISYTLFIMDNNQNYYQLKVKDYVSVVNTNYTYVPIVNTSFNLNLGFNNDIIGIDNILYENTTFKLVSYIANVNWDGGIFNNGIFDGLYFKGLFKNGLIKSGTIG